MSIITNIKENIARRTLNKDAAKVSRNRVMASFSDVKSVGVIYLLQDEQTYKTVADFVAKLQGQHKQIKVIGAFAGQIQPVYYIPKLSFDLLMMKDVNWVGIPKAEFVHPFVNEEFDVLFLLSQSKNVSLEYLYALSHAKLKVAADLDEINLYSDLMFKVGEDNFLQKLIDTSVHYLQVINKKDDK